MTGKELAYLLEKTGVSGKQFANATGINPSSITNYKKVREFRPKTQQRIFDGFKKLKVHGGEIQMLLKQRFEESKKHPPLPISDPQFEAMVRLSDLQYQINQQKRHIEALELNVKLLTEKLNGNG
jgi:transcriptional regulator with XRE-family HTH domain